MSESVPEIDESIRIMQEAISNSKKQKKVERHEEEDDGASEEAETSPPREVETEETNQKAAKVWDNFLNDKNLQLDNIGFTKRICELLPGDMGGDLGRGIGEEITNKKMAFIKCKETNPKELRKRLCKIVTVVMMREVEQSLQEYKDIVDKDIMEYETQGIEGANLKTQIANQQNVSCKIHEKLDTTAKHLLEIATDELSKLDEEGTAEGVSIKTGLKILVNMLAEAVSKDEVSIPGLGVGKRGASTTTECLYQEELDLFKEEVRKQYYEVSELITKAQKEREKEEMLQSQYREHESGLRVDRDEDWHEEMKQKIHDIEEAEKIVKDIVKAGDIWEYESMPAPGEIDKAEIPAKMITEMTKTLSKLQNAIDDAIVDANSGKIKHEVRTAKEFIAKTEKVVEKFVNKDLLKKQITKLERTIGYGEIEVKNLSAKKAKRSEKVDKAITPKKKLNVVINDKKADDERNDHDESAEFMKRMLEAKRKLSKPISLTSLKAGEPAVTNSYEPLGITLSRSGSRTVHHGDKDSDEEDEDKREKKRKSSKRRRGDKGGGDDGSDGGDDDDYSSDDSRARAKRRRRRREEREEELAFRLKLPTLDPKNYWWSGDRQILKYQIEQWNNILATYPPQAAVTFLQSCVPWKYKYIPQTSKTLKEALEKFAAMASSEDLLIKKMIEQMRTHRPNRNYYQDITFVSMCENTITKMLQLNPATYCDHATAK